MKTLSLSFFVVVEESKVKRVKLVEPVHADPNDVYSTMHLSPTPPRRHPLCRLVQTKRRCVRTKQLKRFPPMKLNMENISPLDFTKLLPDEKDIIIANYKAKENQAAHVTTPVTAYLKVPVDVKEASSSNDLVKCGLDIARSNLDTNRRNGNIERLQYQREQGDIKTFTYLDGIAQNLSRMIVV